MNKVTKELINTLKPSGYYVLICFNIKVFYLPTDALYISLEKVKIYIKTYIKIAPTYFGLRPSSGSLHMSLAKVTFIKSV
jgi:hypothetical protein